MAMPIHNVSHDVESDVVSGDVSANPASAEVLGKKQTRRRVKGTLSTSVAKAARKLSADQKKDERRRKSEAERKEKAEKALRKEIKQNETDDRFTSPEFIQLIENVFGRINFDPCWHESSAVKPTAYLDVRQGHNGLRDNWVGYFAFVNPPWSAQDKWLRRAYDQWLKGNVHIAVCLVPVKTDTVFFHKTLIKEADLYFIEGRPRFFKKDGTSEGTKNATMLVMLGATAQQKMRIAELIRGSWCLPSKPSSRLAKTSCASSSDAIVYIDSETCTAPMPHNDTAWTVFCSSSAEREQVAGAA